MNDEKNMIEISERKAIQAMDENDFTVLEDELHLLKSSNSGKEQTERYFTDGTMIFLKVYWDGELVHTVSFTKNRKGDVEMEKVNKNVEVISGLNKADLGERVFELDKILGGLELSNAKIQNIEIELGRIGTDVENTDHMNLTELGMTMMDISHMICMLSDFLHYVSNDLNNDVKRLSELQSKLSEAIKKA